MHVDWNFADLEAVSALANSTEVGQLDYCDLAGGDSMYRLVKNNVNLSKNNYAYSQSSSVKLPCSSLLFKPRGCG